MKKRFILVCAALMLMGCSADKKVEKSPVEITAKEVVARLQNTKQNSFLLYLTTDNCYSCEEFTNMINEVQDVEAFEIYYLKVNIDETDSETKYAHEEIEMLTGPYNVLPTTYYFYQGTVLPENRKEGYMEKEDFETWLKSLHILH